MTEPGACDIFTTAEHEPKIPTYTTYRCGYCGAGGMLLGQLASHWTVRHDIPTTVRYV